jgi:hypothetical protein
LSPLVDCFASNFTEGTVVRDVTCDTSGWAAFNADPGHNLRFEGNTALNPGGLYECDGQSKDGSGFWLKNVTDSTVAGNTVVGSTDAGML